MSCDGVDMLATCEMQMLNAYCGVTHFPLSPVCEPYGVDLSVLGDTGGCAFDFDAGIGTGTLPDGGCIMPSGEDPIGAPDAGPGSVLDDPDLFTPTPEAPVTANGADTGDDGDDGGGDGGCAVSTSGGGTGIPGALLMAAAWMIARRRRRVPSRGIRQAPGKECE